MAVRKKTGSHPTRFRGYKEELSIRKPTRYELKNLSRGTRFFVENGGSKIDD
jgi:hypothetical protein